MRGLTVLCLLVVCCVCLSVAQVPYEDCCLKYVKKLSKKTQINAVRYRVQVTDGGCNLPAVIFTMRKGRIFCCNPNERWVTDLMKTIDNNENDYKTNHQRKSKVPKNGRKSHKG